MFFSMAFKNCGAESKRFSEAIVGRFFWNEYARKNSQKDTENGIIKYDNVA